MNDTKGSNEKKELSFAEQMARKAEERETAKRLEFPEIQKEINEYRSSYLLGKKANEIYYKIKEQIGKNVSEGKYTTNKKGIKIVEAKVVVTMRSVELDDDHADLVSRIAEAKKRNPDVKFENVSFDYKGLPTVDTAIKVNMERNFNPLKYIFGEKTRAYFTEENYKFWEELEALLSKDNIKMGRIYQTIGSRTYVHFGSGFRKSTTSILESVAKKEAYEWNVEITMEF